MQKWRPCTTTKNLTRSPVNSPRVVAGISRASGSIRSKSFQDLKRRRLHQLDAKKNQSRRQLQCDEYPGIKSNTVKKKQQDAIFGSLESLFDVKKDLKLPEVQPIPTYVYREASKYFSSDSETSIRESSTRLINLYASSRVEEEPDIVAVCSTSCNESSEIYSRSDVSKLEELEIEIEDEESLEQAVLHLRKSIFYEDMEEDKSHEEMTDEEVKVKVEVEETSEPSEASESPRASAPPEEDETKGDDEPQKRDIKPETMPSPQEDEDTFEDYAGKPPEYPLPPGVGEGVPIKPGRHRDSILSSNPLTDTQVIREMQEADKRSKIIADQMEEIKQQLEELKNKNDLTDEDARQIEEKQTLLMTLMREFAEITKNLQRLVGLADPSDKTFAKMFDMLPYPHDGRKEEKEEKGEEKIKGRVFEALDDNFDLPQIEYPEDKLPRAIVCGFTEDRIPKLVIPDSRPKGTRCLKKLTGKLSESLNMQEKLVQENAMLEGGKYKLEEALLEKDNTLENLQRKICGLQAEIRIVVKENTELSRQLASRNPQRPGPGSPGRSSTYPGENSPRSARHQQSSCYSYASSPRQESCCCKSCMRDQQYVETERPYQKPCGGSARLSGGGSRGCCSGDQQPPAMSCRGPVTVKHPVHCPADVENQVGGYGADSTKQLAQQLESMETEIQNMQMELANVHRERQQLEQQKKLLKCTGPCAPCSCSLPPGMPQVSGSTHQGLLIPCVTGASVASMSPMTEGASLSGAMGPPSCTGVCINAPMGASSCPQQQLGDLREQYARLQEDYRNKLTEVSVLRADAEKMKQETREAKEEREKAENRLLDVQERLRSMESDKLKFHGSKEQAMEQEQALLVAKQRYREAQDELEELRSVIQDQANQLEDYRNKYLQAQEHVEEQRRQLDLMEFDNARMNENVNLEIGRVKNQFQEKLAELAPIPDILKQTQAKLQEVQQLRLIAERNCEDLSRELLTCKDKLGTMTSQLNSMRSENSALQDERGMGSGRCDELEKKNSELRNENERMKNAVARLEEHEAEIQQRLDEKMHESVQLASMLEQVREDSARQVARTKERCETVRRTMQSQIAEMEKQLAQCRAVARAAQKDRDEIRQKMQGQINNLNEAFEQAQGRIRSLQGHVNYLKTSYSNIFSPSGQGEPNSGVMSMELSGQPQGYDSCDCNY